MAAGVRIGDVLLLNRSDVPISRMMNGVFGLFRDTLAPPGHVDAARFEGVYRIDDLTNGRDRQRNQIRIRVHETDPAAIMDDDNITSVENTTRRIERLFSSG